MAKRRINGNLPITYNQAEELFDRKFDEKFDKKFAKAFDERFDEKFPHYFGIMREEFIDQVKMIVEASELRLEKKIDFLWGLSKNHEDRINILENEVFI